MGVCPRTACGATARVRMYDFASLFKAFKFSLTLRNASKSPCLHGGGGGAWNFEIWWSESDYLTLRNIMHFSAQRIRHYLAHLKPIVSLFAENAQLCTHDVALCRLLSRPSCPPLLRVPYGDALYNLMCARLRITAYALQTASAAGRQNNLRARGGSHTHTPVLMRSVLAHHYWSLVHHVTFWSRNSNV